MALVLESFDYWNATKMMTVFFGAVRSGPAPSLVVHLAVAPSQRRPVEVVQPTVAYHHLKSGIASVWDFAKYCLQILLGPSVFEGSPREASLNLRRFPCLSSAPMSI